MTISQSTVYWITRCDGFFHAGVVFAILFLIATSLLTMYIMLEESNLFAKCIWVVCVIGVISSVSTALLVPTTKEIAAIIVIPRLANSLTVKELGDDVVTLAKEWLEELRPNKKGDAK